MGKDKGNKRQPDAPVPAGAYRVHAAIELFDVTKSSTVYDFAKGEVAKDAATALAVVVDEVLHHFGVELSRKDSAARAMLTIAQTVGVLPSAIADGAPLHVNTDVVVDQVKRAFAVIEDMAATDPVSALLRELHELLLPFDGLDNAVANALPFRVRNLLGMLDKARETESGRVRDALVEVARHLRMVPEGTPPGTAVPVDLDALVDGVRWYVEVLDSVLELAGSDTDDGMDTNPDDPDRAIGIAERVRERLTEHRLLTHNHTPVVGEPEMLYGVTAAKPYRELLAEVAGKVGIESGDPTREQVLAEIDLRERDRYDLHHRMFILLQALGLFDQFDDGFHEISTDARHAVVERVREWKTRLDAAGGPLPEGFVSALAQLRADADLPSSALASPQAWDATRQRVRELAAFANSAAGALRLAPSTEPGPVLDELRAQVAFTDDVARLLKFEHDGDASFTDLRNALSQRLDDADRVEALALRPGIERYREFVKDMANGLGLDGGLVGLDAVAERVTAQQAELRKLRSMADQVALNLGLPRDATLMEIAGRTAKFSAVELGAVAAAPASQWRDTKGATVELFTSLSESPTNKVGSGNTDVVTSWLRLFYDAIEAEVSVMDSDFTYGTVMDAVNRARDAVLAQAPTIAVGKVLEVAGPELSVPPVPVSMGTAVQRATFDVSSFGFATFASELRDMASKPEARGNHDPATLRMVASLCDRMPAKVRSMLRMHGELNERYDRVGVLETDAKIRALALLEAMGGARRDEVPTASQYFTAVDEVNALRLDVARMREALGCRPHELADRVEWLATRQDDSGMMAALDRIRAAVVKVAGDGRVRTSAELADRVELFMRHDCDASIAVAGEEDVRAVAGALARNGGEQGYRRMELDWSKLAQSAFREMHERDLVDFPASAVRAGMPVTDPEATATLSLPGAAVRRSGEVTLSEVVEYAKQVEP
jgi:hypothetical protein